MSYPGLDYSRYLNLFKKNKKLFFFTALSIMTLAVIFSYLLPKKYEAKSTVFVEKNVVTDLLKGITANPTSDDSQMAMTYALTSRTLLTKVINNVDFNLRTQNDAEVENLLDEIRKNINITVSGKDHDLFVVSFQYYNPKVARDFVNTLVQMYIEENVSAERDESYGANKFLTQEIATYKDRLDKAQANLSKFKTSNGALTSDDDDRLLHDIDKAEQNLADLKVRKGQLEQEKTYAQSATDPLKVKLDSLTKKLGELRAQYTDKFPEVVDTKSQIKSLQQEIKNRKGVAGPGVLKPEQLWKVDTELNSIKENEAVLEQFIAKDKEMLNSIPKTMSGIEKLQGEKDNEKNMYDLLFLRQNQSEVSKEMELQDKSTTFRVIDPAVTPIAPVSPNRVKIILLGIAAGIAAGVGLLIAADYLDDSIKTVDSLKALGLPVLAVIPLIQGDDEITREKDKAFRAYILSGCYFSLILAVLAMEALGVTFLDSMASSLHLPAVVARFLEKF